jgi:catalase
MSGDARHYVLEAYKHLKVIGLSGDARRFKPLLGLEDKAAEEGLIEADKAEGALLKSFLQEMAKHRIWSRSAKAESVPA